MGREEFQQYYEDYEDALDTAQKHVHEHSNCTHAQRREKLAEKAHASLEEIDRYIRLLENEAKDATASEKRRMLEKWRECKMRFAGVKSNFEKGLLLAEAKSNGDFESVPTSHPQDQMAQYQARLDRTGRHLDNVQRTLAETRTVADNVADNLMMQRNQLEHAQTDVGQTQEDAHEAGHHLRRLTCKAITNKVVLIIVILLLIAGLIFLSVYKWVPGAKDAIRGKSSANHTQTL